MAAPTKSRSHRETEFPVQVIRTIGTVTLGPDGSLNPVEAAFLIIAGDGDSGEYQFTVPGHPHPNPGFDELPPMRFTVTVEAERITES